MTAPLCPLCNTPQATPQILQSFGREFISCHCCSLVFSDVAHLPESTKEKARYENHKNSIDDDGYVTFLYQAIKPALPLLGDSPRILDYGCGPQPVLSQLLMHNGYPCENYDPYFYPNPPEGKFDIIFSTEVFEHFHHPEKEIQKINGLLTQKGLLVIMTELYQGAQQFKTWWYTRDFTHVSFYSLNTFNYLCSRFGYTLEYTDEKRVVILRKGKL